MRKKAAPAAGKVGAKGISAICARVADGATLTAIAKEIGVSFGTLSAWLEANPERSARAREARTLAARLWDEKAEESLTKAKSKFALSRAKELAHHYRWRAAKVAPRDYGDKLTQELTGADGGPIETAVVTLTPTERASRIAVLLAKAQAHKAGQTGE
jgi:transcriptional regulator with XRE-family HTH domain